MILDSANIDTSREAEMATAIRALAIDGVEAANSGHPGMPMGMADVATVLFNRFMRIDPAAPHWADRDRFVLSAGHGSMLLYSLHHLLGYDDMDAEQLAHFRQLGWRTAGHPEYGHAKGIETTTGPLGQGLGNAVGMAIAEKLLNARFGDDLVEHFTYVIAGDGCLMEGISHESIDMAGHLKLGRLIVMWDDNKITIDGSTDMSTSTDQVKRFEAAGWHVVAGVDGHNREAVAKAIEEARKDPRPSMIDCKTVIGFGAPNKAGSHKVHGAPLGAEEAAATKAALGWTYGPFEVPDTVYSAWHKVSARGAEARTAWQKRLDASARKGDFEAMIAEPDAAKLNEAILELKAKVSAEKPKKATRSTSQMALEVINVVLPMTLGGSADLTPSNNTLTANLGSVTPDDFTGRYMHYGIREHGMAAAMNGIALHRGFIPYGGTFLVFSDYARPSIRLAALMGIRSIFVMTHDSIGLGEDGPTHQSVEQISALRAIPNLNVFRPADAVETAEAWQLAITTEKSPSLLALTRQNLPTVRTVHTEENLTAKGAYVLRDVDGTRDVTLMASGSEVEIVLAAADTLAAEGIKAAVVSAPCLDLFEAQSPDYRASVLGTAPRVACEAAIAQSWYRWMGDNSAFVGMTGFGASGKGPELYEHFGITPAKVAEAARGLISK